MQVRGEGRGQGEVYASLLRSVGSELCGAACVACACAHCSPAAALLPQSFVAGPAYGLSAALPPRRAARAAS
ncbi:hypothetical protein JKP88DRAFT_280759 [Tribonema minus]|uniref:Uncharacterized protein n=1 Tax=Tribonema minus TaxID=303371 RepID=A0A835YRQ0_9STRA|nr:hypothetical protein JKP88DRAFT_280759 [Tribonema minus]